jgi:hypothetical protein
MFKLFLGILSILFFMQISPPAYSEDCTLNDEGICQEGECRLENGQIGACSPTADGCACVPSS